MMNTGTTTSTNTSTSTTTTTTTTTTAPELIPAPASSPIPVPGVAPGLVPAPGVAPGAEPYPVPGKDDFGAVPLTISFRVPEPLTEDIKFMTVLGQALEMFKHLPPQHLRTAVRWFFESANTKIDEYEQPAKSAHS